MKIASLYDMHGNLSALNAVLEDLKEVQPDLIVVGRDIVSAQRETIYTSTEFPMRLWSKHSCWGKLLCEF